MEQPQPSAQLTIALLHKDLKRKLLYVSAVLFIFLPSASFLGSSTRQECRSQVGRRLYCSADPADPELMHYMLLNGPW